MNAPMPATTPNRQASPRSPADIGADRRQHDIAGSGRSGGDGRKDGECDELVEAHVGA